MRDIFFRQLVSADYDEYKRIRLDCLKIYPNNFGTSYEEEFNSTNLKLANALRVADKYNFAFGAFNTNRQLIGIIGFVSEQLLKTKHRGEITQMFVDPLYNGRGVGRNLLQITIDNAFANEQTEQIILAVVFTNKEAVSLYKKLGFKEYGKLENYFKSGTEYFTQSFLSLSKKDYEDGLCPE